MSAPSKVTLSYESRVRVCGGGRTSYRRGIMFPELPLSGSDTVTPSRPVSLNHSLSPSPGHVVRSPHVSASLTLWEVDPVVWSEVESNFYFGIVS